MRTRRAIPTIATKKVTGATGKLGGVNSNRDVGRLKMSPQRDNVNS
jgi:hypothetical protein